MLIYHLTTKYLSANYKIPIKWELKVFAEFIYQFLKIRIWRRLFFDMIVPCFFVKTFTYVHVHRFCGGQTFYVINTRWYSAPSAVIIGTKYINMIQYFIYTYMAFLLFVWKIWYFLKFYFKLGSGCLARRIWFYIYILFFRSFMIISIHIYTFYHCPK